MSDPVTKEEIDWAEGLALDAFCQASQEFSVGATEHAADDRDYRRLQAFFTNVRALRSKVEELEQGARLRRVDEGGW